MLNKAFADATPDEQCRVFAEFVSAMIDYGVSKANPQPAFNRHQNAFTAMTEACIQTHVVFEMGGTSLYELFLMIKPLSVPLSTSGDLRSQPHDDSDKITIDYQKMAKPPATGMKKIFGFLP
jgi:hypothetical protein